MSHISLTDANITDLEEIEKAIATQLGSLQSSGVRVLNAPANGRNAIAYKASVLIYWAGASSEEGSGGQETESLRFAINVQLENLNSHTPAYSIIRQIRQLLKGFSPSVGNQYRVGFLKPLSVDYVALKDGDWLYSMSFSLTLVHPCNHGHRGMRTRNAAPTFA